MKTLARIAFLFLAACLSAQAQEKVVAHTKRSNLLKSAELYSNVGSLSIKSEIDHGVRYPFEFAPPEAPKPVATETTTVAAEPVAEVKLTDEEVLGKLAPKLRPTGMLFRGGKGYLILPQGSMPDGGTIRVTYENHPYIIRVTDITTDSYTLRINEAALTRPIDPNANAGGATRDQ